MDYLLDWFFLFILFREGNRLIHAANIHECKRVFRRLRYSVFERSRLTHPK